jgi:hypothetical protein
MKLLTTITFLLSSLVVQSNASSSFLRKTKEEAGQDLRELLTVVCNGLYEEWYFEMTIDVFQKLPDACSSAEIEDIGLFLDDQLEDYVSQPGSGVTEVQIEGNVCPAGGSRREMVAVEDVSGSERQLLYRVSRYSGWGDCRWCTTKRRRGLEAEELREEDVRPASTPSSFRQRLLQWGGWGGWTTTAPATTPAPTPAPAPTADDTVDMETYIQAVEDAASQYLTAALISEYSGREYSCLGGIGQEVDVDVIMTQVAVDNGGAICTPV